MIGRSNWCWWEKGRDVRVRSVFVRKKAGWGMVGQNRAVYSRYVMQTIHAGLFKCGLVRPVFPPSRPNGLTIPL